MTKAGQSLSGVPLLLRRLPILGVGLALGAAFSLLVAVAVALALGMRSSPSEQGRLLRLLLVTVRIWANVMGGPIAFTAQDPTGMPAILLGWLGLLLIPAHPCYPRPATACVTLLGFYLWFFAGFLWVMVAVIVGLESGVNVL